MSGIYYRYEGAAAFLPSTNNGLESLNAQIKVTCQLGRRTEQTGDFMPIVVAMMEYWSKRISELGFADVPAISTALWKEAHALLQCDDLVIVPLPIRQGLPERFVVSSKKEHILLPEEYASLIEHPRIYSWGDYHQVLRWDWRVVTLLPEGWATCTCTDGLKQYRCRHSIAVEVRINRLAIPDDVKELPGGVKRRRGRPAKMHGGFGGQRK